MDLSNEGSSGTRKIFTKQSLYNILLQCPVKQMDKKLEYLEIQVFEITRCERHILKHKLSHFKSDFKRKWAAAYKKRDVFEKKNESWLQGVVTVPLMSSSSKSGGRPQKPFWESSACTKRRKTRDLQEQVDSQHLIFATQMSLRAAGNVDAVNILKDITNSPTRATEFRKSIGKPGHVPQLSPMKALCMFVEGDFTRRQYNIVRRADEQRFPCYSLLQKAKKQCYPKSEAFRVTSTCAEVKLQDVLDHTCSRLCQYLDEVLERFNKEELADLELLHKWGCDGSHQTQFKQKFEDTRDSDAHIFQSSFAPLRLRTKKGKLLWHKPLPSSPLYCRPIRIRFIHESQDVTQEEIKYVESQIKDLHKTRVQLESGSELEVEINYSSLWSMGRYVMPQPDTASTMRCYLCEATAKHFNDLSQTKAVKPESLSLGISVLHAKIRLFESILHLSYKIPIVKWQIRSEEDKKIVAERKHQIQKQFRQEMGLLVDIPKAGFGNTNEGNFQKRLQKSETNTSGHIGKVLHENSPERFAIKIF